ncbi:ATP-dependent Clp protease adaptor ClpS [Sulfurospirillum sp. 1612]|uniref:ATP-dependent Clp protease adaptor ClpS n=1 Tax=Sulfurospirillum sp. 1612 TaxID=3094835 RepID=UPI002F9388CA
MAKINEEFESDCAEQLELHEPRLYKVRLLNDDFTSMDFVIMILMELFHFNSEKAAAIMFKIHEEGSAVCGIFTYEIAETKVSQVHALAKEHNFPLRAIMEEE